MLRVELRHAPSHLLPGVGLPGLAGRLPFGDSDLMGRLPLGDVRFVRGLAGLVGGLDFGEVGVVLVGDSRERGFMHRLMRVPLFGKAGIMRGQLCIVMSLILVSEMCEMEFVRFPLCLLGGLPFGEARLMGVSGECR